MLGDLRILAVGEAGTGKLDSSAPPAELLLDTERVALQALFDMIRRYKIGYEVELHKRTLECALLSLIGPDAQAFVERLRQRPKNTSEAEPARASRPPPPNAHRSAAPRRSASATCPADRDRRRARRALRAPDLREPSRPPCVDAGATSRRARPPRRSCASSAAGPATASTSTRARSPRRPGSTSAR